LNNTRRHAIATVELGIEHFLPPSQFFATPLFRSNAALPHVRSFSLTLGALPNLDPRRRRQNQAFEEHAHRVVSIRDLPKTLPSLVSLPTITGD
jgi:hypothetical protein